MYILLRNNHLGNIFAEEITIKVLFTSAKPSAIADCRGEFRRLIESTYISELMLWLHWCKSVDVK